MRYVTWTDERGYKHRSLIRDTDPDTAAPMGIPSDPPDLSQINWANLEKALHNALVDRGLFTWDDVQRSGNSLVGAINSVLKREVQTLYRQQE